MLHELLLALLGYTGDLIIDEREDQKSLGIFLSPDTPISDERTFKLAPDISFLQPSERDVIERIITLGFYYRELDRFAAKSRNLSWIRSANESPMSRTSELINGKKEKQSVYRRAIANGIVEVLSVYRSAVLQIEQKLLADSVPILATVTQGLNKFFVLLPPLYELILEIEREDICGGRLLNLLHKRCHCGVPELQTCIQRQEDRDTEHDSSHSDMLEKFARMSTNDASLTDWHLGFHISLDMLPEYIPMRVAESVLFAGKAVRVLRNPSPAFRFQDAVYHQQKPRGSQRIQGFMERFSFQREPSLDTKIGEELLPQSEADKIEAMLQNLKESSEFHKRSFGCAMDSIQAIAASHLWQLVVVRANLNGHLKALKDYFLLAKGDFFQSFLEESRQLMRLPPRQSTAESDLMVPFQLAAIKTISDEDKYFPRVSLRMPAFGISVKSSQVDLPKAKAYSEGDSSTLSDTAEMSLDGWDGIALEYSVDWPLQLFFTQEVLSKYRRIFQYLLRLKRTQMELEKSWASVMHQDHTDFAKHRNDRMNCSISQQRRQRFRPMWRVREHMAFLIRNLQFYIQVDVIESQWNVLQAHIQDSRDFTELVGFHQEYLSALISQSFLDIGSVSRILDSIMKLCLQFCWNIENQESSSNTVELDRITEEFNKTSNSLYTILRSSRLAGSQRAPFLRRFLLRLNFNYFFETTARGVLNVVRPRPILPVLH
ncbi:hypothetical protein TEA_026723 [Camellia sinensis var. sinensis]|uniref:Gamma-tubulin complex component n=1 Tax=Camellia sinensis var. sinensis TaxID=542762 RepID=A0A4S4CVE0_CAMSN|nr:hypothetical protein TEA_026723 [Camellia sinensis var. sinensis]